MMAQKAMKFAMPRNRTISSTCGISIEFKKGEYHLVPPAMFAEVIAAGGVSEEEVPESALPKDMTSPEALDEREKAMFKAFEAIVLRNVREDFTAGGMPHNTAVARETGWSVQAKERDAAWIKFSAGKDD
jgi:hypothetical protein